MTTFHHRLMTALDNAQKSGAHMTPLHRKLRTALREANMKGKVYTSAEELARAIAPKAWGLPRELKRRAA